MLIVTNGLVAASGGLQLHPVISGLHASLAGRAQDWFDCSSATPLSLAVGMTGQTPAGLLAGRLKLSADVRQCWVASPFHAKLMRDHLQVMPEGLLPWAADDAHALAENLNPLLLEEGMQLHAVGAALLLACRKPIDAGPIPFAEVSGNLLPNRHPDGKDGGRLMRLVSEIQMHLHRNPLAGRRQRGEPDVSGLWLWGGSNLPCPATQTLPRIATRNAFLASLVDGKDARFTITDAEQLDDLYTPEMPLPEHVLLMGERRAVWLRETWKRMLPARLRGALKLKPSRIRPESVLWQQLEVAGAIA